MTAIVSQWTTIEKLMRYEITKYVGTIQKNLKNKPTKVPTLIKRIIVDIRIKGFPRWVATDKW